MKIDKYKVTVEFDLAVLSGGERADRISLELNQLFHNIMKSWAKDYGAIATPTKTTLEGEQND